MKLDLLALVHGTTARLVYKGKVLAIRSSLMSYHTKNNQSDLSSYLLAITVITDTCIHVYLG